MPTARRSRRPARGMEERLPGGELLFVGADVGEAQAYRAEDRQRASGARRRWSSCWGWPAASSSAATSTAQHDRADRRDQRRAAGDLGARARVRGAGDEFDELAAGLNDMLERLERSIAGLRHAGDAIAHDLRSPLTRLRARMEAALIDAEAGRGDPKVGLCARRSTTPTACCRPSAPCWRSPGWRPPAAAPDQTDVRSRPSSPPTSPNSTSRSARRRASTSTPSSPRASACAATASSSPRRWPTCSTTR